jgi:hypothetical protein
MQTHYASVDTLLVLCVALAIAASWRLLERGTIGWAVLAGTAVAMAMATKYPGLIVASAPAWAIGEHAWRSRSPREALVLGGAFAGGLVVMFLLACPPCVLHYGAVLDQLSLLRGLATMRVMDNNSLSPFVGWWTRPWLHQLVAVIPYGLGIPVALLAYAGLVVAAVRRSPADRLLLAAIVPFFLYVGSFNLVFPRYVLPLFPGLAMLAAVATSRLPSLRVATAVAVVVVAYGAALSASQVRRFSWDQQDAVVDWLDPRLRQLPASDREVAIADLMEAGRYYQLKDPLIARGHRVTNQQPRQWLAGRPAYFVIPDWFAIAIRRDRRFPGAPEMLDRLDAGTAGYHRAFHIPIPPYLQEPIDVCLDPAFAVDLWQGALGFAVYARDDLPPGLGAGAAATGSPR